MSENKETDSPSDPPHAPSHTSDVGTSPHGTSGEHRDSGVAGGKIFDAAPLPNDPRSSQARSLVAWGVVALVTLVIVVSTLLIAGPGKKQTPEMVNSVGEMQAKYTMGAVSIMPDDESKQTLVDSISTTSGSFSDRLRNAVLLAEVAGVEDAIQALDAIEEAMNQQDDAATSEERDSEDGNSEDGNSPVADADRETLRILRELYHEDTSPLESIESLTEEDKQHLVSHGGWFGELALNPKGSDGQRRQELLWSAGKVFWGFILGIVMFFGAGSLGLVGLIFLMVNLANENISMQFKHGRLDHRLYIETFAIWLVITFAGQFLSAFVASRLPQSLQLMPTLFVFFGSLLTLGWPVYCGAKFSDVCSDIGWTMPKPSWATPLYGIAGYLMGLPLLALGVLLTLLLVFAASLISPGDPATPPAHPIFSELSGEQPWLVFQIFLLATVAAPIVEETMFRGVLYRNLRGGSRVLEIGMSILFSMLLSSFIFAAIHPQGLMGIPALMSLAIAFALAREILDSLVPSMIMHGVSNGIVMTIGLAIFG